MLTILESGQEMIGVESNYVKPHTRQFLLQAVEDTQV